MTLCVADTGDHVGEHQFGEGHIYSWAAISTVHRSRHGIYVSNGEVVSLLTDFGRINPCYPDFHGHSKAVIHYTGSGRRGDQKLDIRNQGLLDAVGLQHSVPLFNKLGVNKWEFLGMWKVSSGNYVRDTQNERFVWKFTLEKV